MRRFIIMLMLAWPVMLQATTFNLPGNAVYDLGKLSKARFHAKWGGGEIPDGFKPVQKGNYTSYRHGRLHYFFGPYPDAASLGKARSHLDTLRAQLIKQDPKFQSAQVDTVQIGDPKTMPEGATPPPTPSGAGGESSDPGGEESGAETAPSKGILSSQEKPPEGEEKPGSPEGDPGAEPEGETGGSKPGEAPEGEPPGGTGDQPEGEGTAPKPSEKPEGEGAATEPGEAEGQKPEGEAAEEKPDGEAEATESTDAPAGAPAEGTEAEGEKPPGEAEGAPAPEGEPASEAEGSASAEGESEAAEPPPEGGAQAERPEGEAAPEASEAAEPAEWPPEKPEQTSEFEEHSGGAEMSGGAALEKVARAFPPFFGTALPARVDLSAGLPPPGNQGESGSCTSWALAYGLKTHQEQREEGWKLYEQGTLQTKRVFSPAYMHHQIALGKGKGADFPAGFKLLKEKGACSWAIMPFDAKTALTVRASEAAHSNASRHRIDFYRLVRSYSVAEVKAQLHAGYPVVVGALLDPSFDKFKGEGVWKQERVEQPAPHAMLCVGYDDEQEAFRLLNSWGTKWGDRGFGWIHYGTFTNIVAEAFVAKDGLNDRKRVTPAIEDFQVAISTNRADSAGEELVFSGTASTAAGYTGAMKIVVEFSQPGSPVPIQASEQRYSTIHGQAANDSAIITLPVPSNTAWTVKIPRKALVTGPGPVPVDARAVLYVDDFGLAASTPYRFALLDSPEEVVQVHAPVPEAELPETVALEEPPEAPVETTEVPVVEAPEGSKEEAGAFPEIIEAGVSMPVRLAVFAAVCVVVLSALGLAIRMVR